jgi:hypothetical protein
MSNAACSPVDERRDIVVAGLTPVRDMHYIACSIMHELDRVRGQGNDTNGGDTNGDYTGRDDVAGAKADCDAQRSGG